jgi:hypothetical protein
MTIIFTQRQAKRFLDRSNWEQVSAPRLKINRRYGNPVRHGAFWNTSEVMALRVAVQLGIPVSVIAYYHNRSINAVTMALEDVTEEIS